MSATTFTIIGYGSLLSERSARSTFGAEVSRFRLGRLRGYRRAFRHTPSFFVRVGIASVATKELASLSVEECDDEGEIWVSLFDLPESQLDAFRRRENEYDIRSVPYLDADGQPGGEGLLCCNTSDAHQKELNGADAFERDYVSVGLPTLWHWAADSGLLPCRTYLRHCVLSARAHGPEVEANLLDRTLLVDRATTIREHLARHPEILTEAVPEAVAERYPGTL